MNRSTLRAFSLGILLSTSLIGVYYYSSNSSNQEPLSEKEAITTLTKAGYKVLSADEYAQLEKVQEQQEETKKEETETTDKTDKQNNKKEKETKKEIQIEKIYTLEIKRGMTADEISSKLKKANIIDDAIEFELFLVDEDYATRLQLGTYQISSMMSFEEIGRTITKNN
ncbi:hypothetical protein SM124_04400 (plasmid) [Bacillus sp. 31A1R]|uniref:YceG-like family protein n=1 Tax=Robertmurraya mangrovi TaxID=3098077 RepID=A0ABU5IV08_9BACI|nr:hypothetical protein [Bacillus sp. 31A1R]MDZ5470989.1 hypothetical protein [Bacillus sp. 31A1R]